MRLPISWLREYVDLPDDPRAIADRLASLGFPVEEMVERPRITGVVVGKILTCAKHPNADRLQVCSIELGGAKPLTIATAATNVAQGQVVPVATIGAKLPQLTIEPRKMRGVDSEGMMISADELALPAEWFEDGIMQLEPDSPLGADVVKRYGLADAVLDVEVTGNRVDAMCAIGLARELAASYGVPLRLPSFENPGNGDGHPKPSVTIETLDCTRFVAQRFEDVEPGPAPAWMRIRLALCGQRPIDRFVDVSNYVMLETGQPLHFYDADKVANSHFIVRDAIGEERIVTLDGKERTLSPYAIVVADERGPLGIGGVMGGASSEVSPSTTAILLEAANFAGARVRRTSTELGLRSEASSRHEKALAPALTDVGAARAAHFMVELGARAFAPHAFGAPLADATPIALRASQVKRLLGIDVTGARIEGHLTSLGCKIKEIRDVYSVTPPPWRRDLVLDADLIEEIARMEGYDAIEAVVPSVPSHDITSAQYDLENRTAAALAALGYREIITHTLHGPHLFEVAMRAGLTPSHHSVEVRNPLSEDQRYLRYAIGPGMMQYLADHPQPLRLFEIGHVFMLDEGHVAESVALTFGFSAEPTDEPGWRDASFLRLKGDCEAFIRNVTGRRVEGSRDERRGFHPGKTAVLMSNGHELANFGRVDPRLERAYGAKFGIYLCNIYLDSLPDYVAPQYDPPSRYPSTYRDLALVVDLDVTAANVERTVAKALGRLCHEVRVFDEYHGPQIGEGRKSLAVRATLQRYDATITDEETDAAMARTIAALRDELGAAVRE